jgi:hypothetical protein
MTNAKMYQVLNTKVFDRIVKEKWNGVRNETRSIVEYSTGYVTMVDEFDSYQDLNWFRKVYGRACEWDRSELSHVFKLFIWKKSMLLRANIELFIVICYSLLYLELIIIFIKDLHIAEHEARELLDTRTNYYEEFGYPDNKAYLVDDHDSAEQQ